MQFIKVRQFFIHISFIECCTTPIISLSTSIFFRLELSICLIQLDIKANLTATLQNLSTLIERAVSEHRPRVIALPEAFGFNYETKPHIFKAAAESIVDGATCQFLSAKAKEHSIYIVGGSIIEQEDDKLYNTCTVWNPNGELIARHRKVGRIKMKFFDFGHYKNISRLLINYHQFVRAHICVFVY